MLPSQNCLCVFAISMATELCHECNQNSLENKSNSSFVITSLVYFISHVWKHNACKQTQHSTRIFGIALPSTRDDVSQLHLVTFHCNEHIFGNWRQILCDFNMEQLIDLVNNV